MIIKAYDTMDSIPDEIKPKVFTPMMTTKTKAENKPSIAKKAKEHNPQ